jgi:integrase
MAWCDHLGFPPLSADPQLVGMYVAAAADGRVPGSKAMSVATIRLHLSAIVAAHRLLGLALDVKDPAIASVMAGVARDKGVKQRQAAPVLGDFLPDLIRSTPDTPLGRRDRALLLVGFGGALRRSEITALELQDVDLVEGRGLKLLIRKSKTDPFAEGEEVAIWRANDPAICPVEVLRAWLEIRGTGEPNHPLFLNVRKNGKPGENALSDYDVVRIVKAAVERIGLDPRPYSGHSLRSGLATTAGLLDAPLTAIMAQTRHKSVQVAKRYVRNAEIWKQNVTERIFRGS